MLFVTFRKVTIMMATENVNKIKLSTKKGYWR